VIQIETNINEFLLKLPINLKLKKSLLDDISEIIRSDIEHNLQTGTGLDGASLEPKKIGGRLFYHTGKLIGSVERKTFINEATVFINLPYAKYINYGTSRIPKREFFGISKRALLNIDRKLMSNKFEDNFENSFK